MKKELMSGAFLCLTLFLIALVPASIDGNCTTENVVVCLGETNCTDMGGFWYGEKCNEAEPICEPDSTNNKCCLGDTCNEMTLECQEGLTPVFASCTSDCEVIGFCEGNGIGNECSTTADCAGEKECENGVCVLNEVVNECTEDEDCDEDYECDVGLCILKETEEEKDKVCCKRTKTKKGETYSWNTYIDRESCVDSDAFTVKIIDNDNCKQLKETIQEKHRLKFEAKTGQECAEECTCTGSTMKCTLDSGREMTVYAGNSGNIIIKVKDTNMSTNVILYHHNNKTYGVFKGNETKEIKIMPDQVKEKIRQRIKQRTCECDEIELTEDAIYEVKTKKKARLFWIFPVREKARVNVDAETGEITKFRNPWWGFLANDVEDESEE